MTEPSADPELRAIQTLLGVLEPLDDPARQRVLNYVFERLGLKTEGPGAQLNRRAFRSEEDDTAAVAEAPPSERSDLGGGQRLADVRSLGESKRPQTVSEQIAVVAYYLAEELPKAERQQVISAADVKKYFKQAGFPLPKRAPQALVHAKNAGYFDSAERGKYRLNPVGHNLVAHSLPRAADSSRPRRSTKTKPKRASRKTARKGTKRKTVSKKTSR